MSTVFQPDTTTQPDFHTAFRGLFKSILRWHQLDTFWDVVRHKADIGWYIYAIGTPVPTQAATADDVRKFVTEIDTLLRRDHLEDYCGIVYVDNVEEPTLIKIFDPNNLGVSCGYSDNPPLPGWILTRIPPQLLDLKRPLPAGRQRWWQALWN
jgi:hypothetical protein